MLQETLENFEFREGQLQMAVVIEKALRQKRFAVVEAGTGTGKTLGYLVPLLLSGKKGVVSTGTKNLQEQVYARDLPMLFDATGVRVDAMMMKGRTNYLCLHRYHQHLAGGVLADTELDSRKEALEAWIHRTELGDLAELPWLGESDLLWGALSATSEQCLGAGCVFFEDCFLNRLRSRAAKAGLIIVNHHLFFADAKIKKSGFGEIIPRFQAAVFDEAHSVEDVATAHLGEMVSTAQLTELVTDLEKAMKVLELKIGADVKRQLNVIRTESEVLHTFFEGAPDRGRVGPDQISGLRAGPGRKLVNGLGFLVAESGLHELGEPSLEGLWARAGDLKRRLQEVLEERDSNWLRWHERKKRSVTLHGSPLDVSERLEDLVYSRVESVVLTSATLSASGTFDYIRSRLGLTGDVLEGIYPSDFQFHRQSLMYIPDDLPVPSSRDFGDRAAGRIQEILSRTRGRALVLFTSYHNLEIANRYLQDRLPYTLLRQGTAPRSVLLDEFRRDIHSVLLATGSFWQGVDVPGESLSCLIVDKLPFGAPDDPLVAARIDAIREKGGNPFMEYQVPSAVIALKQGLGRLIRKNSDRGILSILDVRVLTSRYGPQFLKSLPGMEITHKLDDIEGFLERGLGS